MVRIQAFKGSNKLANGKKGREYWKHFVIVPKVLIDALGWKKGDEVEFRLESGKVILRKKKYDLRNMQKRNSKQIWNM